MTSETEKIASKSACKKFQFQTKGKIHRKISAQIVSFDNQTKSKGLGRKAPVHKPHWAVLLLGSQSMHVWGAIFCNGFLLLFENSSYAMLLSFFYFDGILILPNSGLNFIDNDASLKNCCGFKTENGVSLSAEALIWKQKVNSLVIKTDISMESLIFSKRELRIRVH